MEDYIKNFTGKVGASYLKGLQSVPKLNLDAVIEKLRKEAVGKEIPFDIAKNITTDGPTEEHPAETPEAPDVLEQVLETEQAQEAVQTSEPEPVQEPLQASEIEKDTETIEKNNIEKEVFEKNGNDELEL